MTLPPDISCRQIAYDARKAGVWRRLLSKEEQARWEEFAFEKRRREFLLGRVAARTLLSERLGLAPEAVPLQTASDGAVEVVGNGCAVSIAHSGDEAAAAVAPRAVGVDLERIAPRRRGIERFIFHPKERDLPRKLPLARADALTLCWAVKEATLKALRTGLQLMPSKLRLDLDLAARAAIVEVEARGIWQVRFDRRGDFYLAVAFPARPS